MFFCSSQFPTNAPTDVPTNPTGAPSGFPTRQPTLAPTETPTNAPTIAPTEVSPSFCCKAAFVAACYGSILLPILPCLFFALLRSLPTHQQTCPRPWSQPIPRARRPGPRHGSRRLHRPRRQPILRLLRSLSTRPLPHLLRLQLSCQHTRLLICEPPAT